MQICTRKDKIWELIDEELDSGSMMNKFKHFNTIKT